MIDYFGVLRTFSVFMAASIPLVRLSVITILYTIAVHRMHATFTVYCVACRQFLFIQCFNARGAVLI